MEQWIKKVVLFAVIMYLFKNILLVYCICNLDFWWRSRSNVYNYNYILYAISMFWTDFIYNWRRSRVYTISFLLQLKWTRQWKYSISFSIHSILKCLFSHYFKLSLFLLLCLIIIYSNSLSTQTFILSL